MTLKEYFEVDNTVLDEIESSIPQLAIESVTKNRIKANITFKNGVDVNFNKWLTENSIFRFNFDDFKKCAVDADNITHIPPSLILRLVSDDAMWTIEYNVIDRTRNFWGNADNLRDMKSSPKWSLLFMDSYCVISKMERTKEERKDDYVTVAEEMPTFAERVKSISRYENLMSEILEKINTNTENLSIKAQYTNGENEVWIDDGKTCTYKKFDSNGNQIEQSSIPYKANTDVLKELFKRD